MAAHARELHEHPAALLAQVRHDALGELDRAREVRREHLVDLHVGEVLRGAHHAIAGVGDDGVDPVVVGGGLRDHALELCGVGDVELPDPEPVAVPCGEVVELLGPAEGRRDAVAPGKQLLGELAADAARRSGDEPRRQVGH